MPTHGTAALFPLFIALMVVTPALVRELLAGASLDDPIVLLLALLGLAVALLRGRQVRVSLRLGLG